MTSCVLGMDSFEPWEQAKDEYIENLGDDAQAVFADEGHAIAYALAVDCFKTTEPSTPIEQEVARACQTSDGVLLSDVMTMSELCSMLNQDGNKNVARINGGHLCGS